MDIILNHYVLCYKCLLADIFFSKVTGYEKSWWYSPILSIKLDSLSFILFFNECWFSHLDKIGREDLRQSSRVLKQLKTICYKQNVISHELTVFIFKSSVHLLSQLGLFAAPWTAALQASLTITNFWSLLKLISLKLVIHPTVSSSVTPSPPAFKLSQHQRPF